MLTEALNPILLLAVLACPAGMALMMWFMARGMRCQHERGTARGAAALNGETGATDREDQRDGARVGVDGAGG